MHLDGMQHGRIASWFLVVVIVVVDILVVFAAIVVVVVGAFGMCGVVPCGLFSFSFGWQAGSAATGTGASAEYKRAHARERAASTLPCALEHDQLTVAGSG